MSSQSNLDPRVSAAADALGRMIGQLPRDGIVLGSGLGGIADEIDAANIISYDAIPGFHPSAAPGHAGRLVVGSWNGAPVVALQGRSHLYEGLDVAEVTLPVRVLHALGVRRLLLTNAAGGLNPRFSVGDLVLVDDHVNFTGARFVAAGAAATEIVPWNRVPRLYSSLLIERAASVCQSAGIVARRGTYVCVAGPNYETRAEYRMFRALGGDVIGMSTVPEALAAASLGMDVLAISTVTNVCEPDRLAATDGQAVLHAAESAAWKLGTVARGVLARAE